MASAPLLDSQTCAARIGGAIKAGWGGERSKAGCWWGGGGGYIPKGVQYGVIIYRAGGGGGSGQPNDPPPIRDWAYS